MKKTLARAVVSIVICGLAWGAAGAAEPRIGKLMAYELPEYTIYTTRNAAQARYFANELARFRVTLETLLGKRASKTQIPTNLVILSRGEWEKYLQPGQHVAGFFQPGTFANVIILNGDTQSWITTQLVFHEYTHYFLSSQFGGVYPPWFNEGLAELMGYSRLEKNRALLLIPDHRQRGAGDRDWIPFERMLRVSHDSPEYQSHKLADSFYAQAWLTVHYGMLENREFGRQMFEYLAKLNTLVPQDEAAATFGDLAAADTRLREYARSGKMSSGAIALGDVPEVTLPAPKTLSDFEALALIADLMIDTRQDPDRTRPVIDSLARRDPKSARAAILQARFASVEGDDAAFDAATARAESLLAEGDWIGRRMLASVLLHNAEDYGAGRTRTTEESRKDLERALRWFGEAIQHNNADIEALWGYGTAAMRLDRHLGVAEEALKAAYLRAPGSAYIAVSLANLKSVQGKPDEMLPYLEDAIRYAKDLGLRRWATDTLVRMREYIAERDRIEEENRKQRERYEKELEEYEKRHGKRRKKTG